jgi:pheromone a factor receptor
MSILTQTGLIIIRIYRYRREFSQILSSASTTRSRFIRLLILSLIVLLIDLPLEIYWVYALIPKLHAYSWTFTHSDWNYTAKVPTHGQIPLWNHWIWVAVAYVVFAFFGLAKDARDMYRGWLEKAGIGKILPSVVGPRSIPRSGSTSSWTSKAKLLWGKVGFGVSTTTSSMKGSFLGSRYDSSISLTAGFSRFSRHLDTLPTTVRAPESNNTNTSRTKLKFSFRQFLAARRVVSQERSTVAVAAESDVEAALPTIGDNGRA